MKLQVYMIFIIFVKSTHDLVISFIIYENLKQNQYNEVANSINKNIYRYDYQISIEGRMKLYM